MVSVCLQTWESITQFAQRKARTCTARVLLRFALTIIHISKYVSCRMLSHVTFWENEKKRKELLCKITVPSVTSLGTHKGMAQKRENIALNRRKKRGKNTKCIRNESRRTFSNDIVKHKNMLRAEGLSFKQNFKTKASFLQTNRAHHGKHERRNICFPKFVANKSEDSRKASHFATIAHQSEEEMRYKTNQIRISVLQ